MPHRQLTNETLPAQNKTATIAVDRAVAELRAGRGVVILAPGFAATVVMAAENITDNNLQNFASLTNSTYHIALTHQRAQALGFDLNGLSHAVIELSLTPNDLNIVSINKFTNPLNDQDLDVNDLNQRSILESPPLGPAACAIGLTKIARLLPAALISELKTEIPTVAWLAKHNLITVQACDVFGAEHRAASTLVRVSEANVPLKHTDHARIIAYRPQDGGREHLAIIVGDIKNTQKPPLVRLHSQCFTGDLLGSLRCDCGDQLQGALKAIAHDGAGVLVYLAQEGRGIGLVNKLRAYELQDQGLDTLDANEHIGFDADERVFLPAAQILKDLNLTCIRLLTNNPQKVKALTNAHIEISERVMHTFPANQHNEAYLHTKKTKGGHLL